MESDLAKWENMLGLAESGCELVVEDAKQCVSLALSSHAYILNVIHYLLPSHFLSSYLLLLPPFPPSVMLQALGLECWLCFEDRTHALRC